MWVNLYIKDNKKGFQEMPTLRKMNKEISWTLMEVPVKLRKNSYYVYPQE